MNLFEQAFVVGHEGGYGAALGNWAGGRCGAGECRGTHGGISAAAYPQLDIQALTEAQAGEIYRRDCWDRAGCGRLLLLPALLVFGAAVNNGVGRAVRLLQRALGAAQAGHGAPLCAEFQARRLAFMAGLPTRRTFGTGWSRRLCAFRSRPCGWLPQAVA